MLNKMDCLLLLTEMQKQGLDVKDYLNKTLLTESVSIDVLKYINDSKPLDVVNFYNYIRKSYNKKRSNIYINIVKEIEDPTEVIITLSALLTQILLFNKKVQNNQMFLSHVRANEISSVLANYFKTYDITQAIKLLKLIKADLKVLESIHDR